MLAPADLTRRRARRGVRAARAALRRRHARPVRARPGGEERRPAPPRAHGRVRCRLLDDARLRDARRRRARQRRLLRRHDRRPRPRGTPPPCRATWIAGRQPPARQYPNGPYYWLLITSGFRTYRLLSTFWQTFYPRFDAATPPDRQRLLDALACERFGDAYDPATGIVRFDRPQVLRPHLAGVPPERLDDPHVAFFARRNPGHARGDELACLCELDDANLTAAGRRMVFGRRRRPRRGGDERPRHGSQRRLVGGEPAGVRALPRGAARPRTRSDASCSAGTSATTPTRRSAASTTSGRSTVSRHFAVASPSATTTASPRWVDRIAAGEPGVLTREAVTRLVPSSGSTRAAKLDPVHRRPCSAEFNRAIGPWIADLYRRTPALACGSAYWSISPVATAQEPPRARRAVPDRVRG